MARPRPDQKLHRLAIGMASYALLDEALACHFFRLRNAGHGEESRGNVGEDAVVYLFPFGVVRHVDEVDEVGRVRGVR